MRAEEQEQVSAGERRVRGIQGGPALDSVTNMPGDERTERGATSANGRRPANELEMLLRHRNPLDAFTDAIRLEAGGRW